MKAALLLIPLLLATAPGARADAGVDVVNAINTARQAAGVAPLVLDTRLQAATRWHADNMATHGCFQRAACDGTPWAQWFGDYYPPASALSYIGSGFTTPQAFVDALLGDPAHAFYLLEPGFVGAGAAQDGAYWSLAIGQLTAPVPEPAGWLLLAAGVAAITLRQRRAREAA